MMKNYKLTFSTIKISTVMSVIALLMFAVNFDLKSTTAAFATSTMAALSNKAEAGVWIPDTPTNLGWNISMASDSPNESNPDDLDLVCGSITNGGDSNDPTAAHNWTVSAGDNVIYQREVTFPDTHIEYSYETNNYTAFLPFGSGEEGLWNTRVRSFEDMNSNGTYEDETDVTSDWSEYCEVTLDTSGPELSYTNIPLDNPLLSADGSYDIRGHVIDNNLASYQVVIVESDETGTVEGAEVANYVLNPALPDALQRVLYNWDISLLDGYYKVKLSALDTLGNDTEISEVVLVDNPTPPTSTITISNSPEKEMDNRIANSKFEEDLSGWSTSGAISVVGNDADITPYEGNSMLRMGHADGMNGSATVSQKIDNTGKGLRSVGFWYNVVTSEQNGDSSEPSFAVYLGDEVVHQVWAKDLASNASSGWKYLSVYLVDRGQSELDLRMVTTDSDAVAGTTQVYIDDVNTNTTTVNSSAIFAITADEQAEDATVHYRYTVNGREYTGNGKSGLTFSISAQPDNRLIEHWTVDGLGQEGEKENIYVVYDNQAPNKVNDLTALDESTGDYLISFTAPSDNVSVAASKYEIKYSKEEITAENWGAATTASIKTASGARGVLTAPRLAGQKESLLVTGLEPATGYYFAVKSADATNRWSDISNIAVIEQYVEVEGGTEGMGVVINEARNLSDGSWIELYNLTDVEIDVAGWSLQVGGSNITISPENGDNNANRGDTGETVVLANGYLVVYVASVSDVISLSSNGLMIDEVLYTGLSLDGFSEGRETDGSEQWVSDLVVTPGRANTSDLAMLDPQVMISQHEAFNAMVKIVDALNYTSADYQIEYTHLHDGGQVSELVKGSVEIDSANVEKRNIYFATCSSGGICAPHYELDQKSIVLTVILKGEGIPDRTLSAQLTGDWIDPDPEEVEAREEPVEGEEVVTE